mmetsp:Transcript_6391/g.9308  ORF Transcript_6391/g.9308 Transcript_6391/m.9308 type:complete len:172 (-) Transcript_6391:207-722(-)|eukprot:CAMPEP_0195520442 /NCGR_PEP_ID=MMETSP0794_2-20130614/16902_1 /TAXON_ID=515487 /ORGANISM="Stephanopyxis turris, Strain CCMP 815" /LENGTH=171 /DNA_ID=CAMNT_0040649801 /DNA_START=148 /DNA_END=663 /DNA_ORIENTATION=+
MQGLNRPLEIFPEDDIPAIDTAGAKNKASGKEINTTPSSARLQFQGMPKVERQSVRNLRKTGRVKERLKWLNGNTSEKIKDSDLNKNKKVEKEKSSGIKNVIDRFGGNKKISGVRQRALQVEEAERAAKECSDPKSAFKKTWGKGVAHGQYRKKLTHEKGVRSKKNLMDLL